MMTSLLDAVGAWIGGWLQRFGVKRGIIALLLGLAVLVALPVESQDNRVQAGLAVLGTGVAGISQSVTLPSSTMRHS